MGFRNGCYATVWEVRPESDTKTTVRLSTSRKDKKTGEYVTDFSGFVQFVGTSAASKAAKLHNRDRIRIENTDVSTFFSKEKNKEYVNYTVFSFEEVNKSSDLPSMEELVSIDEGVQGDETSVPWE